MNKEIFSTILQDLAKMEEKEQKIVDISEKPWYNVFIKWQNNRKKVAMFSKYWNEETKAMTDEEVNRPN